MKLIVFSTLLAILFAVGLGFVVVGFPGGGSSRVASQPAAQPLGSAAAPATAAVAAKPVTAASALPAAGLKGADIGHRADDLAGPVRRTGPASVTIELVAKEVVGNVADGTTYSYWTFNGTVPGPFLRVRLGDTVMLHIHNDGKSTFPHSIDLHAVTGPGGGAGATSVNANEDKSFTFKALNPGLYVYHCASAPVPMHIANGMFGMILVEPAGGLSPAGREFYVMQSELYTNGSFGQKGAFTYNQDKAINERPDYVIFNGSTTSLTSNVLKAKVGEKVRIYFGVGGFLPSSFHVIGEIFDTVYPESSSDALHNIQTTFVPAGGASIVEFTVQVPGRYLLVDHSLTRVFNKGLLGYLDVEGPEDQAIFDGTGESGH